MAARRRLCHRCGGVTGEVTVSLTRPCWDGPGALPCAPPPFPGYPVPSPAGDLPERVLPPAPLTPRRVKGVLGVSCALTVSPVTRVGTLWGQPCAGRGALSRLGMRACPPPTPALPARLSLLGSSRGINISGAGGRAPLCTCSRRCTELFRLAGAARGGGICALGRSLCSPSIAAGSRQLPVRERPVCLAADRDGRCHRETGKGAGAGAGTELGMEPVRRWALPPPANPPAPATARAVARGCSARGGGKWLWGAPGGDVGERPSPLASGPPLPDPRRPRTALGPRRAVCHPPRVFVT